MDLSAREDRIGNPFSQKRVFEIDPRKITKMMNDVFRGLNELVKWIDPAALGIDFDLTRDDIEQHRNIAFKSQVVRWEGLKAAHTGLLHLDFEWRDGERVPEDLFKLGQMLVAANLKVMPRPD